MEESGRLRGNVPRKWWVSVLRTVHRTAVAMRLVCTLGRTHLRGGLEQDVHSAVGGHLRGECVSVSVHTTE
jgi:hypothetical protein